MGEDKTLRERVAVLETKSNRLDQIIKDYEGMEKIYESLINELSKTNSNIGELGKKVDKMYPIVRDVMNVKGYGSFTWQLLKWIGAFTFFCITSWHYFKDHIKHLVHYIFN